MVTFVAQQAESPFFGPVFFVRRVYRPIRSRLLRDIPYWRALLRAGRMHLSVMDDSNAEILTPEQVATLLQVSPRTVEEWRRTQSGPPWRRMGRHVRYLRREVLVWFEELDSNG